MSDNIRSLGLTRRQFLKTTAVTAAAVAVGDKLFGGPVSALVGSAAAAAPVAEDKWIPSACWHCRYACGILAHRVNGVVVGVKGNPECELSQGRLCVRGNAVLHKLYNRYQVRAPLKRTNPEKAKYNPATDRWEGVDPGWVEISWEEALNTVAAKLRAVKEKDPRRYLHMSGWGNRTRGSDPTDFATAFGTPNNISGGGGLICAAARHTIAYIYNGTSDMGGADPNYSKYAIMWGRSSGVNKGGVPDIRQFGEMEERGNKYVVIDPRCSEEASKAYLWVKIKPGTDGALGRAFCHVLLNELGIYDEEFMKERSNGPYLIGPDGMYVRSKTETYKDASRGGVTLGKPLIWDSKDGKAKTFDDKTIKDFALEGTYTVDGVKCQPAFQLMVEHYKPFTPEWATKICDVEPAMIRRIAKEYGEAAQIGSTIKIDGHVFPYRPVSIECGRGWQSARHGMVDCMVYAHLNAIVGNQDVPGGFLAGTKASVSPEGDGVVKPKGNTVYKFEWPPNYKQDRSYFPISYKSYTTTWKMILEPEKFKAPYPIEVLSIRGANPTQTMAGLDEVVQSIAKVPFTFCYAYHLDQQAELADIVFPDPGYPGWMHIQSRNLRQPLLDKPLYDTKLVEEVELELAERVGFLPKFLERTAPTKGKYAVDVNKKYTWAEILDRQLRTNYGDDKGLEWFKSNGVAPAAAPTPEKENYTYFFWPNRTTRFPIYFEYLKWVAAQLKADLAKNGVTQHPHPDAYSDYIALPDWKPGPLLEAPAEYDLMATNWKSNTHTMGFTQDNPYLMEIAALHDPYLATVWMNRAAGERKGIKDGDVVWVESYNTGKRQRGEVKLSEVVHPKSVMFGSR